MAVAGSAAFARPFAAGGCDGGQAAVVGGVHLQSQMGDARRWVICHKLE